MMATMVSPRFTSFMMAPFARRISLSRLPQRESDPLPISHSAASVLHRENVSHGEAVGYRQKTLCCAKVRFVPCSSEMEYSSQVCGAFPCYRQKVLHNC